MPLPKSWIEKEKVQITLPQPQEMVWVQGKVKIRVGFGDEDKLSYKDTWVMVKAEILGTLALHEGKTALSQRRWAISHVTCGLLLTHLYREECARKVAEFLWKNYRQAFELEDHKKINRMIPEPIKEWVRHCRRNGRWYDPQPFLEDN